MYKNTYPVLEYSCEWWWREDIQVTVHEMDHPEYLIKIFHKWRHSTTFSLLPRARNSTLPCSLTLMASSQRSPSLAGASGWVWSFLGTHPVCFSAGFICKLKVQPTVEKGPPNTVLSLCLPLSSPFFFCQWNPVTRNLFKSCAFQLCCRQYKETQQAYIPQEGGYLIRTENLAEGCCTH